MAGEMDLGELAVLVAGWGPCSWLAVCGSWRLLVLPVFVVWLLMAIGTVGDEQLELVALLLDDQLDGLSRWLAPEEPRQPGRVEPADEPAGATCCWCCRWPAAKSCCLSAASGVAPLSCCFCCSALASSNRPSSTGANWRDLRL